ncbi:MAG: SGNH/GDSL hydrolase family protein [Phycisphaerales bacterium]|nr:SGNH/GDSL hydrolase family protein [Phycisphaerales bacterium]
MTRGDATTDERRRRSRWGRRLVVGGLVLVVVLVGAEIVARVAFGLGDPPILVHDPELDYYYKPDRTYRRFGNTVHYNAWAMRSDDFPERRSDPDECRVMIVGDSIINGGVLTDQADLATSRIQRDLAARLGRPVVVGNISAGGWSPVHQRAYVERYGLFDADVVVFVLNGLDAVETPALPMPDRVSEDSRPWCALAEVAQRYVPRAWEDLTLRLGLRAPTPARVFTDADRAACRAAMTDLFARASATTPRVLVFYQRDEAELDGPPFEGRATIEDLTRAASLPFIDLGPAMIAARGRGIEPYRDHIHPSVAGQQVLAEAMLPRILEVLSPSD